MGHYDILVLETLQDFFWLPLKLVPATALQALARFQVLLADLFTFWGLTLSEKASTTALSLVRPEGLLLLTSSITTIQNQKLTQLMSGNLAGGEEHLEECRGLQGSYRPKLRGQPKENPAGSRASKYQNVP